MNMEIEQVLEGLIIWAESICRICFPTYDQDDKPVALPKHVKRKRVPYPNAKRGDVVWVGRRKILGVLINKKGLVESLGKTYKCDPKDLWYPYPGEPLPMTRLVESLGLLKSRMQREFLNEIRKESKTVAGAAFHFDCLRPDCQSSQACQAMTFCKPPYEIGNVYDVHKHEYKGN